MSTEPIRVLLVEDDQNLGFVIQDALKRKGYQVTLCRDGKEGLRQFNAANHDLCVLDVMLPQKDGFSLAEDIRLVDQVVPIVSPAKSQIWAPGGGDGLRPWVGMRTRLSGRGAVSPPTISGGGLTPEGPRPMPVMAGFPPCFGPGRCGLADRA